MAEQLENAKTENLEKLISSEKKIDGVFGLLESLNCTFEFLGNHQNFQNEKVAFENEKSNFMRFD